MAETNGLVDLQTSTSQQVNIPASILAITDQAERQAAAQLYVDFPRMAFAEYIHKPLKADRMRFDNRPWMDALYLDPSDKIVVVKSSKTGISEWALCDLFSMAQRGLSGMYVLPDRDVRNRFITTRFDVLTRTVVEYRANLRQAKKEVDAKGLKTIYGQTWAFVGSGGKATFFEFNADAIIFDEYDKCDHGKLIYADDRTLGAARDIWRKIGNPTVSGFGISEEFEGSDKKFRLFKCGHCNDWQKLEWVGNFIREEDEGKFSLINAGDSIEDATAVCRYCEGTIDRIYGPADWVPEYQGRAVSGYQVGRLFAFPGNDEPDYIRPVIKETFATFLKAQGNPTRLQRFWNNILGLPFAGSGSKFNLEILEDCKTDYIMPMKSTGTYAGVDVGGRLHLHIEKVIKGKRRKLFIGTVPDWNELHTVCKRFGVTGGVVDAEPEHHKAKEWCDAHPNWYVCYYNLPDTADDEIDIDFKTMTIRTKRTASLDESLQACCEQRVEVPKDYKTIDGGDFARMMCASTRVQVIDAKGKVKFVWTKADDHHQHTDNYARIASEIARGANLISVI